MIRCVALWAVMLFCITAPTPLTLAAMVVFGHAYFTSALGDTLRTTAISRSFYLRLLSLCALIIGSHALLGWGHWLNTVIPQQLMAVIFLCYCSYQCIVRRQRFTSRSIGSHATLGELITLNILFGVCLGAYILLDHPFSNMAHYLFEPAYFYLWFVIHCACTSRFTAAQQDAENAHTKPENTFGSMPM